MTQQNFAFAVLLKGVDQLSDPLGAIGGKFGELGGKAIKLGKTLTTNVTLPLVALGALAAREFIQAEDAQLAYANATGKSRAEVKQLARELEQLPRLADDDEQMAGLTAFSHAGIDLGESMLANVGQAQTLAFALKADVGEAAQSTAKMMRAWNIDASKSQVVTDALAAAALRAGIPMGQFADIMSDAAVLGRETGQDFSMMAAEMITFQRLGLDGAAASKKMLLELQAPSVKSQKVFARLGLGKADFVDANGNLRDITDTLELLNSRGAKASDFSAIFGNRIGPALAQAAAQGTEGIRKLAAEIEKGGIAQKAAGDLAETIGGKWTLLGKKWQEFLGNLADASIGGLLEKLLDGATRLVDWMNTLSPETLKWVGYIGSAAAAVGPVLVGLGTAVKVVGLMTAGFNLLKPLIGLVFGPWGVAIAGIWAGASLLWDNWDAIKTTTIDLWHIVEDKLGGAFDWVGGKVSYLVDKARELKEWVFGASEAAPSPTAAAAQSSAAMSARAITNRTIQHLQLSQRQISDRPKGEITVNFQGAPKGTRVSIDQAQDLKLNTQQGLSMAAAY